MTHPRTLCWRLAMALVVVVLILTPALTAFTPEIAFAQQDLSVDPKGASPSPSDLRAGFQLVPDKSEQREPVPGITVYEADFVRDQTPKNFADGPIEIKSLVAKTANSQQAADQFASSRQALTTASPPWVESKQAKLGDDATGLTMEGTSSEGPAVAHLFLFRRGAMVVGITVAGLKKPTKMAEAESIAAIVLKKIDPSVASQTGPKVQRPLNMTRPPSTTAAGASTGTTAPLSNASSGSGPKFKVANTGGTGVRMRAGPSKTAQVATVLPEGTVVEVVGDDKQGDGLTWKNVRGPGDGKGYVASDYLVAVAAGSTTSSAPPSPVPASASASTSSSGSAPANASNSPAPNPSPSASANPPASTIATSPQGGNVLKVDVGAKSKDVKAGDDQTITVTVTNGGQPVTGAQVTVKTSPTGETPAAPPTDASGKTTVTWKPTGSGFIGVGVSVLATDGGAGVGGASFQVKN
jgi:hypothetical protein